MNLALFFSFLNGIVGLLIGLYIAHGAIGDGWGTFPVFSTLSAFLVSFLLFYLLNVKFEKELHFLFLGLLVVFLSHYFTFFFQFLYYNLTNKVFHNFQNSLSEPPAGILNAIWMSLIYSLLSLFMIGWITIPLGVLISYFFRKK